MAWKLNACKHEEDEKKKEKNYRKIEKIKIGQGKKAYSFEISYWGKFHRQISAKC